PLQSAGARGLSQEPSPGLTLAQFAVENSRCRPHNPSLMDPQMVQYIREGAVYLIALILSICVHEFGHAFVADRLGDPLPRSQGRVTLNPISHIDFIGTLVLPVVAFAMSITDPAVGAKILGWGKPVQISLSPRAISRNGTLKTAHLLIALAGPMMNILFGLVLSI